MAIFAKLIWQGPNASTKMLPLLLALFALIHSSKSQYYLEEKPCGVFHSEQNLQGQEFALKDRDQSIHLSEDPRASDSGWNTTGSITVESGCVMELCNETYFDGECLSLAHGSYPTTSAINLTDIVSASCNCYKECKCSDIYMKKSSCARAYLAGGCKTCNSLYTDMSQGSHKYFPDEFVGKVEALRLRKGCTLTVYSEEDMDGDEEIIDAEIIEGYSGEFRSYECACDDSLFEPRTKPPRPESYPPLLNIPTTMDDVIKMLTNKEFSNHPGLRAAYTSLKNGKSSKNAYIMLLGSTGSGKSSAINLLFDNPNVTAVGGETSTTTDIHEFRIPVPIDEIGVGNSELRVIDTPGLGDTRGLEQDAKFLTTLDAFLTNHEELKDRIPNVVLIFHKFHDNRFNGEGSGFVKMLRGLDSFRQRITDDDYSNVIFVLSHFCSETKTNQKRPDARLGRFKSVIENYSLLPKPTIITVAENKAKDQELPMVNGYFRLPDNEYYPKNLFEKLELVTEKGGDPIGLGVFRTAFRDSDDFNVTAHNFKLLDAGNKIDYYFRILSNAFFSINKTEISQLLQHTWDEKLAVNLKKQFPGSLPYLQKALSIRNINTKEDIPKTTTGILELLTAIKHDEATRELLGKSLQIRAPGYPHDIVAGHSYNVFNDRYLPSSPFVLGDVQGSDIGFMIPKILTCKLDPNTKQNFHLFNTREEYLQHRLKSLGIDGNIGNSSFDGIIKPGHNIREISFKEDSCSLSATREFRLFEFELNDKLDLTPQFVNSVKSLTPFNESDPESVEQWQKFFNDYGTHVVKSVHGGGAIEIQLHSNQKFNDKLAHALFGLVKFAEEMSFMIVGEEEEEEAEANDAAPSNSTIPAVKTKTVLPEGTAHSLTFIGGDSAFHTDDLTKMSIEKASKLLTNWKKSLKYNPAMLTTEMRLLPISQVAKKLGQNYASEIDRATSKRFKSELRYVPPKKNRHTGPGNDRPNTEFMDQFLKVQAESNQRIHELMLDLRKMEAENQKRQLEMEQKRLEHEQEQKKRDQEFKLEQLRIQQMNEEKRQQYQAEADKMRREAEDERFRQQQKYNEEMRKAQQEADRRNQELLTALINRPPPDTGSCLKEGTKILMADMTEKSVETLQVGDLLMDMDFKPTRVLGVSFEFLLAQKFYGFDDKSFFFTESHLFAGPFGAGNGNDLKLYARNTSNLFHINPLMEYLNVADMQSDGTTELYHVHFTDTDNSIDRSALATKSVVAHQDPTSYSPNTPIYFIQVDSPSGTYFANGYVCRHEVPPVEHWPNTMSVLFRLMETPIFASIGEVPYEIDTVYFMEEVTAKIAAAVRNYIVSKESDGWNTVGGDQEASVMTLKDINLENCVSQIFSNPTVASVGVSLYAKVGRVLAPLLDSESFGRPNVIDNEGKLGQIQYEIFELIMKELQTHLKLKTI